jgi:hypothetical protein
MDIDCPEARNLQGLPAKDQPEGGDDEEIGIAPR